MRPGWAKNYLIFSTRLELAKKSDFSDRSVDKKCEIFDRTGALKNLKNLPIFSTGPGWVKNQIFSTSQG
jgi:hypothetical protein